MDRIGHPTSTPAREDRGATRSPYVHVAIALGSNLGDRTAHLDHAVTRLRQVLSSVRVSTYHETVPVGAPDRQPLYLNASAVASTDLSPRALLEVLLAIERERDRERTGVNAARTLDLDLILHGDARIDEPGLIVPHPRFRERSFVLDPLVEVGPALVDPVTGLTVAALRVRLEPRSREP